MTFASSLFEKRFFDQRLFYIKRDDLLHPDFSGNKARKFEYFLAHDFPKIKRVVSYGSNQSNAMYSLSVLAKMKNWEFVYFCDHIPSFLKQNPVGNYKYALQNKMKMFESKNREHEAHLLEDETTLVIEEGGRQKEAEFGLKNLAQELLKDIERFKINDPYIFLPSGTGTTALFLQKHLPFNVYTCSTVGGDDYLIDQWKMADEAIHKFPLILSSAKKYHYGKLYKEAYGIWDKLKTSMDVEFDLLYDPIGWLKFLENIDSMEGTPIYIHQGGLKGNESMQARYERKYGKII
ncbi:MAG: 1-aminocyclopropane-1-carboxylate deaminase/D-cysteine desulfhydrase [Sulfurospirillaceae bacterium]|nr:1-aminocyclopropane-1-carboxylate deaminase/D-cysteine desulfhydrase [Sulfurospirillaceae bacterium]